MCIQTRWSMSQHNMARCRKPSGRGHRSGTGQASKSSLWGRIIRHIHSDTFLSLRASWLPSRYARDHIRIRVHVWHENFDGRVFNVVDGPRRPKSTRRVFRFASFIPPPPDSHPSDSGSGGAAYPASGNFTSCKDKDGGDVGEVGVSGVVGGFCSWKTLWVPVILAGRDVDEKKNEKNHEKKTQLPDFLRCYLLEKKKKPPFCCCSSPSPPPHAHY